MRKILLNPGPATTSQTVKRALLVDDICPREKDFQKIVQSIREDLVKIAGGDEDYTCVLFAGSGTLAMESCMTSIVPGPGVYGLTGYYALILSNGAYGERFSTISNLYSDIKAVALMQPYGKPINIRRMRKYMETVPNIGGVFVTHHETTTGILNNIKEIGKWVKEYNIPYIVDTISSFGGVPFNIRDIKADFVMSTSNKCLQGMPGVSFVIAKKDELEKCKFNYRTLYLDLYRQWEYQEKKGQFRFTPPVQVLYSFRQALDEFFEEGATARRKRYIKSCDTLVKGMKDRGFKQFLSDKVEHSKILETFYDPKDFDFKVFHDKLYKKGFTVYPGKTINDKTFRVAVMGNINYTDIELFLEAVDKVME